MQNSEYLKFAIKLAKESGKILVKMQGKAKMVNYKGKGDYALDADIKSEKYILAQIKKKYPDHAILSEETGMQDKESNFMWVIDPLEGTLNYANKIIMWAVNIALLYKGKPFMGVIYAPLLKELFYAEKGKGAYLNGKKIKVNDEKNIVDAIISFSMKYSCKFEMNKHGLRYLGCEGLELAYVANGRFGARIRPRDKDPFGYAAGSIIVLEAGGKFTDYSGKKWKIHSEGILASNGKLHNKILKLI